MFMETWLGGGFGRALGGYDEMIVPCEVRDQATISTIWLVWNRKGRRRISRWARIPICMGRAS